MKKKTVRKKVVTKAVPRPVNVRRSIATHMMTALMRPHMGFSLRNPEVVAREALLWADALIKADREFDMMNSLASISGDHDE